MMRDIYCDMDGVLADFDAGYERAFGRRPTKEADDVDWELVRAHGSFYETLPPMRDAYQLWDFLQPHLPTVLTGVPQRLLGDADTQKHRWLYRNLGPDTEVICTLSRLKCEHCKPGDILIDDWEKYKHLWEAAGGIWVTHTDAASTIEKLKALGLKGGRTW